jgi:hypothetical protein
MLFMVNVVAGMVLAVGNAPGSAPLVEPMQPAVPARLPDILEMLSPTQVRIDGWLGARITANVQNRLLKVDT